jgi:hypothetical protein
MLIQTVLLAASAATLFAIAIKTGITLLGIFIDAVL